MKTAIVYKSAFGTTRQYAQWLHESISSDLYPVNKVNNDILRGHEMVVVCGSTYAGKLVFNGFLKKNMDTLLDKKLVLVAVGMAPPDDKASVESYETIPEPLRKIAGYYKLQGKMFQDKNGMVKKENLNPVIQYIEKAI